MNGPSRAAALPRTPGCLPGRRPVLARSDRSRGLRYGPSDDGGVDDVEESLSSRCCNSSTCAARTAVSDLSSPSSTFTIQYRNP